MSQIIQSVLFSFTTIDFLAISDSIVERERGVTELRVIRVKYARSTQLYESLTDVYLELLGLLALNWSGI